MATALGVARTLAWSSPVCLTFDDGPHPLGTPAVLECLERAKARAVFFLVGEQVDRDPGLAREIADRGHTIGIHGYRHRNLLRVTPRALRADFDRASDVIAGATGSAASLYRPPYGIFSAAALAESRRRGWRPLLWSQWGRDWRHGATASDVARLALRGVGAGDVILLHDADHYSAPGSWRTTACALGLLLPALAHRGFV